MLYTILQKYRSQQFFDSAVCRISTPNGLIASAHAGSQDTDLYYDVASISKIITTTLVLETMEQGKLHLNDLILSHLPELRGPATQARLGNVTVYQLMTHTSGILPWYPFYAEGGGHFEDILEHLMAATDPEPGYAYSDINFMLLGMIYSSCTGNTLPEGVSQVICRQLGISGIQYGPLPQEQCIPSCRGDFVEQGMCRDRHLSFDGWRPDGADVRGTCNDGNAYFYFGGVSGHAGIFATAKALEQLCHFYLTTDDPVFVQAMEETCGERGLGFDKSDLFPDGCGHTGFTGPSIYISRRHQLACVLLLNRLYLPVGTAAHNVSALRREIHAYAIDLAELCN